MGEIVVVVVCIVGMVEVWEVELCVLVLLGDGPEVR